MNLFSQIPQTISSRLLAECMDLEVSVGNLAWEERRVSLFSVQTCAYFSGFEPHASHHPLHYSGHLTLHLSSVPLMCTRVRGREGRSLEHPEQWEKMGQNLPELFRGFLSALLPISPTLAFSGT